MKFWILLLTLLPSVAYGQNNLFCQNCTNNLFESFEKVPLKTTNVVKTPTWTWPGDLATHLRTTHGVETAGMSHQQMVDYHSHLHNTGSGSRSQIRYQSSCPGGVCPTPTSFRLFRRRR